MSTSNSLLTLSKVHTHIGQYHILQGIDLTAPAGQLTVILGRNGAGKTTTMRSIMGLEHASAGTIMFDGRDITQARTETIARLGISYVPENMGIFGGLTVRENMVIAARHGSMNATRLDWILERFPPLKRFWNMSAGNLSGGQKQMLSIARAVIEPRALLLIDEPSKGLAPAIVQTLIDTLLAIKQETTIVLIEQNFSMASQVADTVVVVEDGRTAHAGSMAEFIQRTDLQQRLLGLSLDAAA
ncbi:MAG: ABC transporter ATP-binding protein [Acetobacteraceae bacterium]